MHTMQLIFVVMCGLIGVNTKPVEKDGERQPRVLLHSNDDVIDVLAKTQAMVASLNSTVILQNSKY